jgi:hypothetical protein
LQDRACQLGKMKMPEKQNGIGGIQRLILGERLLFNMGDQRYGESTLACTNLDSNEYIHSMIHG